MKSQPLMAATAAMTKQEQRHNGRTWINTGWIRHRIARVSRSFIGHTIRVTPAMEAGVTNHVGALKKLSACRGELKSAV